MYKVLRKENFLVNLLNFFSLLLYYILKNQLNDEIYATGIACYAYASTVHKTQGDSFEYVVIDLEDEDKNLKWLYTALTRTNKDFILYGKKSFTDWF